MQVIVNTVTGHTDRIGSKAYDKALFTRRGDTLNNYLIESAGIAAAKIIAIYNAATCKSPFSGRPQAKAVCEPRQCGWFS